MTKRNFTNMSRHTRYRFIVEIGHENIGHSTHWIYRFLLGFDPRSEYLSPLTECIQIVIANSSCLAKLPFLYNDPTTKAECMSNYSPWWPEKRRIAQFCWHEISITEDSKEGGKHLRVIGSIVYSLRLRT